ncbi:MAG: hypothetical protein JW999_11540 [Methanotrichaceae archaeon]|nr:hypothetical protein [Methanotrichaceae archaeon]
MKHTEYLEEAVSQRFVIETLSDNKAYENYWQYCRANRKPFVAVRWKPSNMYAHVVLDLSTVPHEATLETVNRIEDILKNVPKKNRYNFIDAVRTSCHIKAECAERIASALYDLAVSDIDIKR